MFLKVNKKDDTIFEIDILLDFKGVFVVAANQGGDFKNKCHHANYLSTIFVRQSSALHSQSM